MEDANEYIVFEPDQVLTNKDLNQTFNYLDQQNRWTRNKLIGIGIACGFNISHQTGIIEVSGGCGVTSQGYLIFQQTQQYAYITTYAPIKQPNDLPFSGTIPFFDKFCNGKAIQLLLTDDDYNALENVKKPQAKTLSSQPAGFLKDYVVVLFLEASELDLKNCDTFDCTNKGEKIQFKIRPLLVKKSDLPNVSTATKEGTAAAGIVLPHQVLLKRYNVPYKDLKSHVDVIRAFTVLVDNETLQEVSNALNYCYQQYSNLLGITTNAFANLLGNLQDKRELILSVYPIFIQYFYDFIDDLIKAYYEFRIKMSDIVIKCCPDENLFPLHLVLGDASKDTSEYSKDDYRHYFIYSPLFAKGYNATSEGLFFYRKMEIMVKEFGIQGSALKSHSQTIKITPSQYGLPLLSERAIPYYYKLTEDSSPLYENWSFYKTSRGNATFNQSYNAYLYNKASVMVKPLLYDIEHYNFFRIEGHIGENYQAVLSNLLKQRQEYNLPFDVVAISADLLRSDAVLPECNMQDLETDYKLIISEFACKVHTRFCQISQESYQSDKASDYTKHVGTSWKKGDFIKRTCSPKDHTIGSAYLAGLKENFFTNPVKPTQQDDEQTTLTTALLYLKFAFLDAVEEIMKDLHNSNVAFFDIISFNNGYEKFKEVINEFYLLFDIKTHSDYKKAAEPDSKTKFALREDTALNFLWSEYDAIISTCIDERLKALKEEYRRRLHLYQSQHTFLNYFKSHPGLEHKAGVPKGGTFVIVYYENAHVKKLLSADVNREGADKAEVAPPIADGASEYADEAARAYMKSRYMDNSSAEEISGYYINKKNEKFLGDSLDEAKFARGYAGDEYLDDDSKKAIRDFVDNCKDASDESRKEIYRIIDRQRPPTKDRIKIINHAVIADFYIPYLCCSDCMPVAYILPREKEPEPPVVFTLPSDKFLFDDANNYAFTAEPPVTNAGIEQKNFSSPDIINSGNLNLMADEKNTLYLHPAMELGSTLNTTITYKDIELPVTIIVPDASFTINPTRNVTGAIDIKVTANNTDAETYEWTVTVNNNDIPVNNTKQYQIDFNMPIDQNDFSITLVITYTTNIEGITSTSADIKTAVINMQQINDNVGKSFEPEYSEKKP